MDWQPLLIEVRAGDSRAKSFTRFFRSVCFSCKEAALWRDDFNVTKDGPPAKMLWPSEISAPSRHPDMPQSCVNDFEEARQISALSPRGAAALLRLCVQKLCKELDQPGRDINADIGALVKLGLPTQIQKALDVVRVIGNEAVHPGVMLPDEHAEHVAMLFDLVNFIVDRMISEPKAIDAIYDKLPPGKRAGIEQRDSEKPGRSDPN